MKIHVAQFYIELYMEFPFSFDFNHYISDVLNRFLSAPASFLKKYSVEYDIIIRLSAKKNLFEPEIRGPTLFRKDKDIEYAVFLPGRDIKTIDKDFCERSIVLFLESCMEIFNRMDFDTRALNDNIKQIASDIASDRKLVTVT